MSAFGSRERALLQHLQLGHLPVATTVSSSSTLHHSSDGKGHDAKHSFGVELEDAEFFTSRC